MEITLTRGGTTLRKAAATTVTGRRGTAAAAAHMPNTKIVSQVSCGTSWIAQSFRHE
jgi:hypothetical protein